MQETTSNRRPLSTASWAALIGIVCLAAIVAIGALVPTLLKVIAVLVALLIGFAICALPFATVIGIVLLITHHRRTTAPVMYMAQPGGALPYAPPPHAPHARHAVPAPGPVRRPPDPAADLPPALQALVAGVQDKMAALRDPRQWHLVSPEDQIHVERIGGEYLPAILQTFRGIPRGTRGWQVTDGGPTALDVVERQLRLLEQSLDAIAERVFRAGAAQLLAQQQFLEDRLGEDHPGELTIT